jgi:type IX secretion system PorP/SprF family membrane protein
MLIKRLVFFLVFFPSMTLLAQDVHLSQFEASPLFLNASLGGEFNGDWRIGNSVREQWRSIEKPYQSFVFFFDKHLYYYSKVINAGLIVVHDKSGNANLTGEKVYVNLSYPIGQGKSKVVFGLQPGIVMKYYKDDLTFPEQYDHSIGYFNQSKPNNEGAKYGNTRTTYFDLNAGIYWKMSLPKIKPSVGISILHINQADESFNKNASKIPIRENIHGNVLITLKNKFYLRPSFLSSIQNKANQLVIGSNVGKKFPGKGHAIKELFAGLYARNGYNRNNDAIIPLVGMQYLNWRIGMSYDVNVSDLSAASSAKGAIEFSIIYMAPSTAPEHTAIPCERY